MIIGNVDPPWYSNYNTNTPPMEDIQFVDDASSAFSMSCCIDSSRNYNRHVETSFHIFGDGIIGLQWTKSIEYIWSLFDTCLYVNFRVIIIMDRASKIYEIHIWTTELEFLYIYNKFKMHTWLW